MSHKSGAVLAPLINAHFAGQTRIRGAEIGVWRGQTSAYLLEHVNLLTLYMVDPYIKEIHNATGRNRFENQVAYTLAWRHAQAVVADYAGRAFQILQTSVDAAKEFDDYALDFVFIDAGHTYEDTRQDITTWTPKVKPDGIVAGHDYNGKMDREGRAGVKLAVDEFFGFSNVTSQNRVWWVVK